MEGLARTLVLLGVLLAVARLLLHWSPSIPWLGKLPGDIRIERPGLRVYLPITSCPLVCGVLSLVLALLSKLCGAGLCYPARSCRSARTGSTGGDR